MIKTYNIIILIILLLISIASLVIACLAYTKTSKKISKEMPSQVTDEIGLKLPGSFIIKSAAYKLGYKGANEKDCLGNGSAITSLWGSDYCSTKAGSDGQMWISKNPNGYYDIKSYGATHKADLQCLGNGSGIGGGVLGKNWGNDFCTGRISITPTGLMPSSDTPPGYYRIKDMIGTSAGYPECLGTGYSGLSANWSNDYCTSDEGGVLCPDGILCEDQWGIFELIPTNLLPPEQPLQPCVNDDDCAPGASGHPKCGKWNTSSDNAGDHMCCPSGDVHDYGLHEWCTDQPDGNKCRGDGSGSSPMCKSKCCDSNDICAHKSKC